LYPPSQAAYDRAITVFSPDGRLFQVEYAREAVRTGATSLGVVCRDGVVLVAHKRISSRLAVSESHEKIFQVDAHIAASSSGLVADARRLIDYARLECQKHRLSYSEEMPVESLAKSVSDHIQFYTQYAGVRPYGVSLLIAGSDGGNRLFETDPSGALFGYRACAIGSGKKAAEAILEKEYQDGLSADDGVKLALKALKKASGEKLTADTLDVAVIKKNSVRILSNKEKEKWL